MRFPVRQDGQRWAEQSRLARAGFRRWAWLCLRPGICRGPPGRAQENPLNNVQTPAPRRRRSRRTDSESRSH